MKLDELGEESLSYITAGGGVAVLILSILVAALVAAQNF